VVLEQLDEELESILLKEVVVVESHVAHDKCIDLQCVGHLDQTLLQGVDLE